MRRVALIGVGLGALGAGLLAAGVLAGTDPLLVGSTDATASASTETTATATGATTVTTRPASPSTAATSPAKTATRPVAPSPPPAPKPAPVVRLAGGITIGGVHVGGLTPDAAYAAVKLAFEIPLRLVVRGRVLSVPPEALGTVAYVRAAVAEARHAAPRTTIRLHVNVQAPAVAAYVGELAQHLDRQPSDSSVVLRNLRPVVRKWSPGWTLDVKASVREIVQALTTGRRTPVRLALRELKPKLATTTFPVVVVRRESDALYLYRGSKLDHLFHVATGQSYPTPLGRFEIVVKWEKPWWYPPDEPWAKGAKPIPPGPGNPLGTRWMGLSSPGVGIHGTPDAASVGYSLSHGCVRMSIPDAEWLFGHVDVGTPVFIVAA